MKNKTMNKLIPAAAGIIMIIFTSCGGTKLPAPTGLTATGGIQDNPNRIELSWLPVKDADIYYIYRDGSESGDFSDNVGLSVTSNNVEVDGVEELRYLFVDNFEEGEGGTYWYRVSAASDGDIVNTEGDKSAAVKGDTYVGTWSDAKDLGSAAKLKLAAGLTTLYAVYSAAGEISFQTYAGDETSEEDEPPMIWTPVAASPGNTSISVENPFSVLVSGNELYTAFRDEDNGSDVTMKYYHDSGTDDAPSFDWIGVGDAGFNDAVDATVSTEISAATVGFGNTPYAAFLEGTAPQLYAYNSNLEQWEESTVVLTASAENIRLLGYNNTLYVGYENTDGTNELYLRSYNDSTESLQAGGLVEAADIETGNVVFLSGGGDLYAIYITSARAFEVEQLVDNVWTPLSNISGKPAVPAGAGAGTLAALWYNGYLHVFYVDATDRSGWVKYYDVDKGWLTAAKNSTAITGRDDVGSGLSSFQLASMGTSLYAGYIENGKAYVKILE